MRRLVGAAVVVTDHQIEEPVAVGVAERRPRAPVLGSLVARPAEQLVEIGSMPVPAAAVVHEQLVLVRDEDVGPAIVADVADGGAETPKIGGQTRFVRAIAEAEIALVVKQLATDVAGQVFDDEQIERAVAVVVERNDVARFHAGDGEVALRGHVDEPTAVVAVQGARARVARIAVVAGVTRDDEVQIAIIVEVGEHRSARAGVLLQRGLGCMGPCAVPGVVQQTVRPGALLAQVSFGTPVAERTKEQIRQAICVHVPDRGAMPHHAVEQGIEPRLRGDVLEGDHGVLFRVAEVGRGRWPIGACGQSNHALA